MKVINHKVKKGCEKMVIMSLYDRLLNDERYEHLTPKEKTKILKDESKELGVEIVWK
tara:strand:- start:788 stop:958 length:171 start_codon:yes stop_codon:yes gene_type:complete